MNKMNRLQGFILSLCFVTLASCGGATSDGDGDGDGDGGTGRDWTYMVYMGGDNNLSQAAAIDIGEMEDAGSDDNVAIVVQAEFSPYYTPDLPSDTFRLLVQDDGDTSSIDLSDVESLGSVNMVDPAELTEFINWAKQEYPADHYALTIWDHGAGWKGTRLLTVGGKRGAVTDETTAGESDIMTLPELAQGVRDSDTVFDVIDMDVCLLGMYEVAYEFKGLTNYLSFSQEVEPGDGDDYTGTLNELKDRPSMDGAELASVIVDTFDAYFQAGDQKEDSTKSAIDMSKIDDLHTAITDLASAIGDDASAQTTLTAAGGSALGMAYPENKDLNDIADYLETRLSAGDAKTAATTLKSVISEIIINNKTNGATYDSASGLAIYLPSAEETTQEDLDAYSALACNQNRASESGTWGALVETLVTGGGGASLETAMGGFGLAVEWFAEDNESACDADIDLYVFEPNEELYAPWIGTTTPNGFMSMDSFDSGESLEYYLANETVEAGEYLFIINYYDDGPSCDLAAVHLYVVDPANDIDEFEEIIDPIYMDLSSPGDVSDLEDDDTIDALNQFSNWWVPTSTTRSLVLTPNAFPFNNSTTIRIGGKRNEMILRDKKGSRLFFGD